MSQVVAPQSGAFFTAPAVRLRFCEKPARGLSVGKIRRLDTIPRTARGRVVAIFSASFQALQHSLASGERCQAVARGGRNRAGGLPPITRRRPEMSFVGLPQTQPWWQAERRRAGAGADKNKDANNTQNPSRPTNKRARRRRPTASATRRAPPPKAVARLYSESRVAEKRANQAEREARRPCDGRSTRRRRSPDGGTLY